MDATKTATDERLIRLPEVMRRTGMSRSWIYAEVQRERFPAPLRLGGRAVAWRDGDVTRWLAALPSTGRPSTEGDGA